MTNFEKLRIGGLLAATVAMSSCNDQGKKEAAQSELSQFYTHVAEAFPNDVLERQLAFDAAMVDAAAEAQDDGRDTAFSSVIIRDYRRWAPGSTITVAFPATVTLTQQEQQLRTDIEQMAKSWTAPGVAQLTLSFRQPDGRWREWSANDTGYAADVRITFAGKGYWSGIGRMSNEPAVFHANEASMRLGQFLVHRPANWRRVVIHEFGHALGFMHEHQNVNVNCAFRFADDPGYMKTQSANEVYIPDGAGRRPGLYTWFSGAPNKWDKPKVDQNLGPIGFTTIYKPSDFEHDAFDRQSIMKYYFEPEFFIQGTASPCFTSEALTLSAQDKAVAARSYRLASIDNQINSLEVVAASPEMSRDVRRRTAEHVSELKEIQSDMQ